jgi:hypothetical protein
MQGIFIYRYYSIYARFCHPLLFLRAHSYVKFNANVKKIASVFMWIVHNEAFKNAVDFQQK